MQISFFCFPAIAYQTPAAPAAAYLSALIPLKKTIKRTRKEKPCENRRVFMLGYVTTNS